MREFRFSDKQWLEECRWLYWVLLITSGKNHFHEMNGDVGMAGWK